MAGVYTDQRLNLSKLAKACGRKAKVSKRTREIWPSGIIGGASGKEQPTRPQSSGVRVPVPPIA
jgi:hypothetical protein